MSLGVPKESSHRFSQFFRGAIALLGASYPLPPARRPHTSLPAWKLWLSLYPILLCETASPLALASGIVK